MKKTAISFAIILVLLGPAALAGENVIVENETVYSVLNEITSSYASRGSVFTVKYVITENRTEIDELESREYDLNFSIARAGFESVKLEKDNTEKEGEIGEKTAALSSVETERNRTGTLLSQIESKKQKLEGVINSSVLLPSSSYNTGIAIFIVLILLAITMKSRSILLRNHLDMKRKGAEKDRKKE
ncbi:MAG: hypothetical protein HYW27_03855 [Candidatus Aenigmarchaeota archaeon]|nr:hypothetical protein [Candidatus Aenigmarchaeota archaeon]